MPKAKQAVRRARAQEAAGKGNSPPLFSRDAVMAATMQVAIDDNVYDQMLAEVEALPERKRKQWKSSLLDEQGARSRLICPDGKLLNYSLIRRAFVEAVPQRSWLLPRKVFVCSRVGQEVPAHGENITTAVEQEILTNCTGEHHRNHFVKVGKQSDGRVRG